MNSIIHLAIHVLVACDFFFSNGRPVVALATSFALVKLYLCDFNKINFIDNR